MNTIIKLTLLTIATITMLLPRLCRGQADGNPHNWDRRRRCDQTDYSPPCRTCEGYGGIPYGDENDQIHLTTCEIVNNATAIQNPVKPVWGPKFTLHHYNEVLIGPKTDPFCFNAFPSNTSKGKLCYRADSGSQTYDAKGGLGLRYDLNVKTVVGNVTTMVLHQGENMWIINKLPWYAAGVHQCICTKVHQDSDPNSPDMYPVQYNWTDQMYYMGREKIGIEYQSEPTQEVLEHWAFGPHHVWSKPGTGEIRRMWQPFNGLQVLQNGTNDHYANASLLQNTPPPLCKKKGGATFRIKCDDNGFPKVPNKTIATKAKTNKFDKSRAKQAKPRSIYRGDSFAEMSNTLNRWLKIGKHTKGRVRDCATFSAAELQKLQGLLYLARDESLNKIYEEADDNRKLAAPMEDLMESWKDLNNLVDNHDDETKLSEIQRDGHCHEAVMWFVHHITEDMKQILKETTDITIPLLSPNWHGKTCTDVMKSTDNNNDETYKQVCNRYREQVTCASCHSNVLPPMHDFLMKSF